VVQVKTVEIDGYNAVQLGFSAQKVKNSSKAELAHAKKAGLEVAPRVLSEVRLNEKPTQKAGDVLTVEIFKEGQLIDKQVIAGTFYDGYTLTTTVATIDEDWTILMVSGQSSSDTNYDASGTRTQKLELLPEGQIITL
jgi:hypothetical protein